MWKFNMQKLQCALLVLEAKTHQQLCSSLSQSPLLFHSPSPLATRTGTHWNEMSPSLSLCHTEGEEKGTTIMSLGQIFHFSSRTEMLLRPPPPFQLHHTWSTKSAIHYHTGRKPLTLTLTSGLHLASHSQLRVCGSVCLYTVALSVYTCVWRTVMYYYCVKVKICSQAAFPTTSCVHPRVFVRACVHL